MLMTSGVGLARSHRSAAKHVELVCVRSARKPGGPSRCLTEMMRWLVAVGLAVAAQQQPAENARTPDSPIRLVLPSNVHATDCQERSFLIGPFGGAGDFARPRPGDRIVQVSTSYEGTVAGSLKAYLWCPGYEVWTLSLDPLSNVANRTITPTLTPRASVTFSGVVRAWAAPQDPLTVHVNYWPAWICAFFRLPDCAFGPWPIADVSVSTDGTFSVDLPDFARDRVIESFGGAGYFEFSLRDKDGNTRFGLRPTNAAPNQRRIAPSPTYPAGQSFDLEPYP